MDAFILSNTPPYGAVRFSYYLTSKHLQYHIEWSLEAFVQGDKYLAITRNIKAKVLGLNQLQISSCSSSR